MKHRSAGELDDWSCHTLRGVVRDHRLLVEDITTLGIALVEFRLALCKQIKALPVVGGAEQRGVGHRLFARVPVRDLPQLLVAGLV